MTDANPAPEREDRLNRRQRDAVEWKGDDLLVRAGAGSGKTRVLTRRFHHLATEEGVPVEQLVAITFTDRAAGEMKERVARRFPREQREAIEFAPISTIHAFCARLLHEEAIRAGLDPHFGVLEPLEADALLDAAFDGCFRRWREERPDDAAWLLQIGVEDLQEELIDLYRRVRSHPVDVDRLSLRTGEEDLGAILERARELESALEDVLPDLSVDRREIVRGVFRGLEEWAATAADTEPLEAAAGIEKISGPINLKKFAKKIEAPAKEAMRTMREEVLPAASGWVLDATAAEVFPRLRDFLVELHRAYEEAKEDRAVLDFADLEHRTLGLLRRLREGGESVEREIRHVLVDEYQDTNPIQEEILQTLRELRPASRRFAVGDPMQSIYRFRGAEIEMIRRYQRRVGEERVVYLDRTYRPAPELRGFQNTFFGRLFAGGGGTDFVPLEGGGEFDDAQGPRVEMLLAPTRKTADGREAEAALLALHVREMIDSGRVRITDRGSERRGERIGPGDITFLLRATTDIPKYERALRDAGLPAFVVKGHGFYEVQEVLDLENLLRAVVRPTDVSAAAGFLASPYVGLSDEDLFRLFLWLRREGAGRPWQEASSAEELPERLRERVDAAAAQIEALRAVEGSGGIAELVERAIHTGRYDLVALLQPQGVRHLANLRKILEMARRLDRDGGYGAADMVRMIEDLRRREIKEREAPLGSEAEDVIRIMTVHSAKGLEFPVVVVPDLNRQFVSQRDPLLVDREGGVSFRLRGRPPGDSVVPGGYAAIQEWDKQEDLEEEKRLLYVAMTRAQEHLILSSSIVKSPLGWLGFVDEACGLPDPRVSGEGSLGDVPYRIVVDADAEARLRPGGLGGPGGIGGAGGAARDASVEISDAALAEARGHWERISRPAPGADVTPFVVSTSDILRFASCPLAYFWSSIAGVWGGDRPLEDDPTPSPRPGEDEVLDGESRRRLGTAVHALLETCDLAEGPSEEDAARVVADEFGPLGTSDLRERALALSRRFVESDWGRRAAAMVRDVPGAVMRERRFILKRERLLVKGTIDLLLRPPGEAPVVLDYKTGAPREEGDLDEKYEMQMRIYALAARGIFGEEARAILFYLESGDVREVPPDPGQVDDLFRRFAVAHERTAPDSGPEHFGAEPDPTRCHFCEFRGPCPEAV